MRSFYVPRLFLGAAAILLVSAAAIHANAFFSGASTRLGQSNLSPLLVAQLRVLWLADSSTLAFVGLGLALLALRPRVLDGTLACVVCAIPAATAALLYCFLGSFFAAHLLLAATGAALIGIFGQSRPLHEANHLRRAES